MPIREQDDPALIHNITHLQTLGMGRISEEKLEIIIYAGHGKRERELGRGQALRANTRACGTKITRRQRLRNWNI